MTKKELTQLKALKKKIEEVKELINSKTKRRDSFAERAFYAPNTAAQDALEDVVRDLEGEIYDLQKELKQLEEELKPLLEKAEAEKVDA